MILILAFILLVALLLSEARYRRLLMRLAAGGAPGEGAQEKGCCGGKGCCKGG